MSKPKGCVEFVNTLFLELAGETGGSKGPFGEPCAGFKGWFSEEVHQARRTASSWGHVSSCGISPNSHSLVAKDIVGTTRPFVVVVRPLCD